jgi:LCP family protein required for cell wall assembly
MARLPFRRTRTDASSNATPSTTDPVTTGSLPPPTSVTRADQQLPEPGVAARGDKSAELGPVGGEAQPSVLAAKKHRHRTLGQRVVLGFNSFVSLALLATAALVGYSNHLLGSRKLVDINGAASVPLPPGETAPPAAPAADPAGGPLPSGDTTGANEAPPSTTPVAPGAKNFLLTASDSRDCIDPDSPFAGAFGDAGDVGGQRADTIMMLRVEPASNKAAILSFPRDLWVKIPGRGNSRINGALDPKVPRKLIDTIGQNFYLGVDHYINVDFCAFKGLVDAVDGVSVPFAYPARDKNTGLIIDEPGCWPLRGDEALAYVRSRKYQWLDPVSNKWKTDGTSDFGRITRQQDFLKRTLQKALDNGARNPIVANKLISTATEYVTTDQELTIDVMLELATAMRAFDAGTVKTFQVDSEGMKAGDASVQRPLLNTTKMKSVLSVFRGQASILDIPEGLDPTTVDPEVTTTIDLATTVTTIVTGGATTTAPPGSPSPSSTTPPAATTTTIPVVVVEDDLRGVYPPSPEEWAMLFPDKGPCT